MGWAYSLGQIAEAAGGAANHPDITISSVCTDTRKLAAGQLFVALKGDNFDANAMLDEAYAKGAAAVSTTRTDAPGPAIVCDDPLAALQRFASWHRQQFSIPVFAITGSVGKTTTKDFVATVLGSKFNVVKTPGNLNNAIGCPLSLLEIQPDTGFAVIEMGANHPGEIAELCDIARPTESVITMIGETHVEGFGGSVEAVAAAKAEIAKGLKAGGVFYVNLDDPRCKAIGEAFPGRKIYFGGNAPVRLVSCEPVEGGLRVDIAPVGPVTLPLSVPAQAASAVIAVAVGLQHGLTEFAQPLRQACANAPRFRVSALGPLTIFDDSYNASPPSMRAALAALALHKGGRKLAALGDMFELGPVAAAAHRTLGEDAAQHGVDALFALGPHAALVAECARAAGVGEAMAYDTHEAIAAAVAEYAQSGDALLVKGSRGMKMERVIDALKHLIQE